MTNSHSPRRPRRIVQELEPSPQNLSFSTKYTEDAQEIEGLVASLRTMKTHPETAAGWWCTYRAVTQRLVVFISNRCSVAEDLWCEFRNEMAMQLSRCRQCAIAYHRAFYEWESSSYFVELSNEVAREHLRSVIKFDLDRVFPLLRNGALPSSSSDDTSAIALRIQCREAFLESLLSLRVSMEKKYLDLLPAIFLRRTPVDNAQDMSPFLKNLDYLPPGLIVLCFHPKSIVHSWALQTFKQFSHEVSLPSEQTLFVLSKAFRVARQGLQLDKPTGGCFSNTEVSIIFLSASVVIPALSNGDCAEFVRSLHSKCGSVIRTLSLCLDHEDRSVVTSAALCIEALVSRVPYHAMFGSESLPASALLCTVFRSFRKATRNPRERRSLLRLLAPVLACANKHCPRKMVAQLYAQCFDALEWITRDLKHLLPSFIGDAAIGTSTSCELHTYQEVLKTTSCLLNWYYTLSAPKLPLPNSNRIVNFVTTVLRDNPENSSGWDLLRTVLVTDVLNILRCVLSESDVRIVADSFLSKRPDPIAIKDEEKDILSRVVVPDGATPMITFLSSLWNSMRQGRHLSSQMNSSQTVVNLEIKVLLDLHRLLGVVDPQRIGHTLTDKQLNAISWRQVGGMGDDRRKYICDTVGMMQDVITNRLCSLLKLSSIFGRNELEWWPELPYHATHLLCSFRKELGGEAMTALLSMYSVKCMTVDGSSAKMVAHYIKASPEHTASMAVGFLSSMRVLYAWGEAASMGSFTRFFLWYRVLLDMGFSNILSEHGCSEWVVGVLLSFLRSWKDFEKENLAKFSEVCSRFLGNMREVWLTLCYGDRGWNSIRGQEESNFPEWVQSVLCGLLDMHTLQDANSRSSWVQTMCKLAPTWGHIEEHRSKILGVISMHSRSRKGLTLGECRSLAQSIDLDEADAILQLWEEDEGFKRQKQNIASAQAVARANVGTLKVKRPLRDTKIEDHFGPRKNQSTVASSTKRFLVPTTRPLARPAPQQAISKIAEMRKDHRLAKQESRSAAIPRPPTATSAVRKSSSVPTPPQKTKFEVLIEQNKIEAEKRRKERADVLAAEAEDKAKFEAEQKRELQRAVEMKPIEISDNNRPRTLKANAKPSELQMSPSRAAEEDLKRLVFPSKRRFMEHRLLEDFNRKLLREGSGFADADNQFMYLSSRNEVFADVGTYVKFWEPLVIEECRASLGNSVMEGKAYVEQNGPSVRKEFQVEGTVESVGYQQWMNITCDMRENPRNKDCADQYDIFKARNSDLVLLEISPFISPRDGGQCDRDSFAIGMVLSSSFGRGQFNLKLNVAFKSLADAPGCGQRLQVNRLSSLTTFHRQIGALWEINKLPDGIIWPLLDPAEGWRISQKAANYVQRSGLKELSEPRSFIQKMQQRKFLNKSQAHAINSVVLACLPLYKGRASEKSLLNDHGGVSLIQGPPGTGKTSTVLALLSTLLFANCSNVRKRKAAFAMDDGRVVVHVPPVRILVCAPSNAAVDEIMSRVIKDGLSGPSGGKACPQVLRVGAGTTVEALEALELRRIAKCDDINTMLEDALNEASEKKMKHISQAQALSSKIGEVDKQRKMEREALAVIKGDNKEACEAKSVAENSIRDLTAKLTSLHAKKNMMQDLVTEDRASSKEVEAQKKRESDLAMCQVLNRAAIVFATLNSAGHEVMQKFSTRFDVVIVDEAAQCCEPDILIPVTVGRRTSSSKTGFAHLVLVGDPRQLPATILSSNHAVSKRMGISLFERFATSCPESVHMLDTQYRMHPKISCFPSNQFYRGLLENGDCVLTEKMGQPFHQDPKKRFGPLTFIDTSYGASREIRSSKGSVYNPDEAKVVLNALVALVCQHSTFDFREKIAVLSPYREQVVLLKRMCAENISTRRIGVEVNTIDGIQGREKPIVILSTVRGGNASDIGFVRDERRMNVAITRAKHSVIVVGHAGVLTQHSGTWASFVAHCRAESCLIERNSDSSQLFPESRGNNFAARKGKHREGGRPTVAATVVSAMHARKRVQPTAAIPSMAEGPQSKKRCIDRGEGRVKRADDMDIDPAALKNRKNDARYSEDRKPLGSQNTDVAGENVSRNVGAMGPFMTRRKYSSQPVQNGKGETASRELVGQNLAPMASAGLGLRSRRVSEVMRSAKQEATVSNGEDAQGDNGDPNRGIVSKNRPCTTCAVEFSSLPPFQPSKQRGCKPAPVKKELPGSNANEKAASNVGVEQEQVNECGVTHDGKPGATGGVPGRDDVHMLDHEGENRRNYGEIRRRQNEPAKSDFSDARSDKNGFRDVSFATNGQHKKRSFAECNRPPEVARAHEGFGGKRFDMNKANVAPWMEAANQQSDRKNGRRRAKNERKRNRVGDASRNGEGGRRFVNGPSEAKVRGLNDQEESDPHGFDSTHRDERPHGGLRGPAVEDLRNAIDRQRKKGRSQPGRSQDDRRQDGRNLDWRRGAGEGGRQPRIDCGGGGGHSNGGLGDLHSWGHGRQNGDMRGELRDGGSSGRGKGKSNGRSGRNNNQNNQVGQGSLNGGGQDRGRQGQGQTRRRVVGRRNTGVTSDQGGGQAFLLEAQRNLERTNNQAMNSFHR